MKKWLRIALILIFSGIFLFSGYQLLDYYRSSREQQQQFDDLAQLVQQSTTQPPTQPLPTEIGEEPAVETTQAPTQPGPLPEYMELYELNSDFVGWLQIEDTRINYPVMQTPNSTDHYLHRDFYGNYSAHGCLYAREQCDVLRPSDNITIYGHNMKDGSMFADLLDYRSQSFYQEHRYIQFNTRMERHTYEIFAVLITTATQGSGFAYHQFVDASDPEQYDEFVAQCKSLSLYDTGITPVCGDKLITLSTCEYTNKNGRFVVVAKQVS